MSRQRRYQLRHKALGLCCFCSRPTDPESISRCSRHFKAYQQRQGVQKPRPKQRWKSVDWSLSNKEIAAQLHVSAPAVEYQRRQHQTRA